MTDERLRQAVTAIGECIRQMPAGYHKVTAENYLADLQFALGRKEMPQCPSCGGYHPCPREREQATPERPAPAPKRGPRELERVFADGDLRVWCRATNLSDEGERQAQHYRLSAVTQFFADMTQVEKAEAIARLDFVNAVEVKTHYGAVLIYPEWP